MRVLNPVRWLVRVAVTKKGTRHALRPVRARSVRGRRGDTKYDGHGVGRTSQAHIEARLTLGSVLAPPPVGDGGRRPPWSTSRERPQRTTVWHRRKRLLCSKQVPGAERLHRLMQTVGAALSYCSGFWAVSAGHDRLHSTFAVRLLRHTVGVRKEEEARAHTEVVCPRMSLDDRC